MGLQEMRVAVYPGQGIVARFDRAVLLVVGPHSMGAVTGRLVEACRSVETAGDALRAIVDEKDGKTPPFCGLIEQKDGVGVYAYGSLRVSASLARSRLEFAPIDDAAWLEETLRGAIVSIAVAEKTVRTGASPMLDLVEGVVPGAAVEMVSRTAAATEARPGITATTKAARPPKSTPTPVAKEAPPALVAEPAEAITKPAEEAAAGGRVLMPPIEAVPAAEAGLVSSETFDQQATMAVDATKAAASDAAVVVQGLACANGHINDPLAEKCWICDSPLTNKWITGPRPSLGRLVAKDGGSSIALDRNLILGRKPSDAPEVARGGYGHFEAPAGESAVSRVHAEVRVDQWNVLIIDRNSANGTFVRPPGTDSWIQLEPGHAVQIAPGYGVMIGPLELRYDRP